MAVRALGLVGVYLIGAIPVGFIVARFAGGIDIRRAGSGNIGATNVLRTVGKWAGVLTLLGDIGKGYLAVAAARRLGPEPAWAAYGGVLAVVGNCWPVFLRFHGGKGVATGFGAFLNLALLATAPAALVWLVVAASFRYASLASILAWLCLPLGVLALGYGWNAAVAALVAAAIIIGRHHGNIRRLLSGTEPRLGERATAS